MKSFWPGGLFPSQNNKIIIFIIIIVIIIIIIVSCHLNTGM
jgi:hypothetical protein